jgi:hypothetical protein
MSMKSNMSKATARWRYLLTPLSRAEERRCVGAALAHLKQTAGALTDYLTLGTELLIEKAPKRDGMPRRCVRVIVADYGNCRTWNVVLNASGDVEKAAECDFQPAFHPEEIKRADAIGRKDRRIAECVARRNIAVEALSPAEHTHGNGRLIGLRYVHAPGGRGKEIVGEAVIDLCKQIVVTAKTN